MNKKSIEYLQILSISLIWLLFTGIAVWIVNLIRVSLKHHDAPDASVGISIVAIPVFFILASVLTYVFVGLRKGRKEETTENR
jgi:cytosine/uracil/thiamine/allantoin permease